jgi:hypothetical protein
MSRSSADRKSRSAQASKASCPENLDEGLQQAGDGMKALAPKCKGSVASAGR